MRVLMAVDLTADDAEDFVAQAVTWVERLGATVDLLFVNEAADAHPYILDPQLRQMMSAQYVTYHDDMERKLTELLQNLPEPIRGHAICVKGRAVTGILDRVDAYDGIVIGHRPLSALTRLAIGMTGERVARGCRKPILMIPR